MSNSKEKLIFGEFGKVECQRNSNVVTPRKSPSSYTRWLHVDLKKSSELHVSALPSFHFFVSVKAEEKSRVRETTSTLFQGNKGRVVEWIHEGRKRRPSLYASKLHVHFIIREGSSDSSGASELASTPLTHHFTGSKTITKPPTNCIQLEVHNSVGFVVFMTLGRVQQLHQSGRATISSRAPWFKIEEGRQRSQSSCPSRQALLKYQTFKREGSCCWRLT